MNPTTRTDVVKPNEPGCFTGCILAVLALLLLCSCLYVRHWFNERSVRNALTTADSLWQEGKKGGAVEIYKSTLNDIMPGVDQETKATAFQRVIEYEMENENTGSAKNYMTKAANADIKLSFYDSRTANIWAEVQAKRAAERAELEARVKAFDKINKARLFTTQEELQKMTVEEMEKAFGTPNWRHQSVRRPGLHIFSWKKRLEEPSGFEKSFGLEDQYLVVAFIRRTPNEKVVLNSKVAATWKEVEEMRDALEKKD
jgi:hypothetical protein